MKAAKMSKLSLCIVRYYEVKMVVNVSINYNNDITQHLDYNKVP